MSYLVSALCRKNFPNGFHMPGLPTRGPPLGQAGAKAQAPSPSAQSQSQPSHSWCCLNRRHHGEVMVDSKDCSIRALTSGARSIPGEPWRPVTGTGPPPRTDHRGSPCLPAKTKSTQPEKLGSPEMEGPRECVLAFFPHTSVMCSSPERGTQII